MGVKNLIPLLITMQLIKTNNVQSFCEYWHRRTKKPCRVGIDASTVIHTHLRKHKDTLMINASNIDKCPHFRKSLKTTISEMKKWDVVLHFVCDGRRINMKLQNAERARLRKTAHEQLSTATDMGNTDQAHTDRLTSCAVGSLGPAAALVLISVCNELGVSCEIALFESEHQLAALQRQDKIDIILANDSDFIRLGCSHIFFPGISTVTKKFNHLWFHDCRYWPGTSALDTYAAPILNWPPSAKNDISTLLLSYNLKENSFVKLLCIIMLVNLSRAFPLQTISPSEILMWKYTILLRVCKSWNPALLLINSF